jgi:uncharacterized protein
MARSNRLHLLLIISLSSLACSARPANQEAQADNSRAEIGSTLARKYSRAGFVNDFANVITAQESERLNAAAKDLLAAGQVDAAIVTLPSLEGEPIEQVSLSLGQAWQVGAGKKGLVLCVAIAEHQSRIDVTRSLEGVLTNEACSQVLKQARGWFANGQYGRGCEEVMKAMRAILDKEGL